MKEDYFLVGQLLAFQEWPCSMKKPGRRKQYTPAKH
jgi:hypothetical protein